MKPTTVSATGMQRRIGLFGGSFDPIHMGHLIIASEALQQLSLDEVIFLPAGRPPHKPDQQLAADHDRVAMIELAIAGRPVFSLSDIDLGQDRPSYSAELVERMSAIHDDDRLFFIIGSDSLRDFHTWYQPHRITALSTVAVVPRPGVEYDLTDVLTRTPSLNGNLQLLSMPLIDISSTEIRRRAECGEHFWYQVPTDVESYMLRHRLYGSSHPQ